jgi:RNA polymerase sigma-70 factor (ECF subfamily)
MDKDVERGIVDAIPKLRRYAFGLTGSWDKADDLTQDCLERAMRKSHLWQRRGSVRNWLLRILYREFLNSRRGRRMVVEEGMEPDDLPADPAHAPSQDSHMACADMLRVLFALPHRQRAAMLLVVVEGYSYDETAAILDIPVGTVRSRLARARETLEVALPRHPVRAPRGPSGKSVPAGLWRVK